MLILVKVTEANMTHVPARDSIGQFLKGSFTKLPISGIQNKPEDIYCARLHLKTHEPLEASLLKASLRHNARKPWPKAKVEANDV